MFIDVLSIIIYEINVTNIKFMSINFILILSIYYLLFFYINKLIYMI